MAKPVANTASVVPQSPDIELGERKNGPSQSGSDFERTVEEAFKDPNVSPEEKKAKYKQQIGEVFPATHTTLTWYALTAGTK